MTTTTRNQRQDVVKQTLASWALEGFEPDREFLSLCNRFIAGDVTTDDMLKLIDDRFNVHQPTPALVAA